MISKFNVELKTLLRDGISEAEFYSDLVYNLRNLIERNVFSFPFRKMIIRYKRIGYNLNVMLQSACFVFNPVMVDCCLAHRGSAGVFFVSMFGAQRSASPDNVLFL